MTNTSYLTKARRKPSTIMQYDPRPLSMRNDTMQPGEVNGFITDLQSTNFDSMWGKLLQLQYADYQLCATEIAVLKQKCIMFENSLHVLGYAPVQVVPQQRSLDWFYQRQYRINASVCHDVATIRSLKRVNSILSDYLWFKKDVSTKAMLYGQLHEATARTAFCELMQETFSGFSVVETGMWVNPAFPQIACSPDGLVTNPVLDEHGLVEIKCPQVIENANPLEAKNFLTAEQWQSFCLTDSSGELRLKRNHKYYYQVQCQLGVTQLPWCYFVVWSKKGLFFEKVLADISFWSNLKAKLVAFHKEYFVPEFFEMRVPRNLEPMKLVWD